MWIGVDVCYVMDYDNAFACTKKQLLIRREKEGVFTMKKYYNNKMKTMVISICLCVAMLLSTVAFADFDPSVYSDVELLEISASIKAELDARASEPTEVPTNVENDEPVESNPEDFIYVLNKNEVRINAYKGTRTDVVIPATIEGAPVTGIAPRAFNDNESITSVYIPDTVTYIGEGAFGGCSSIQELRLPLHTETLTIEEYAFSGLSSLTSDIVLIGDEIKLEYHSFSSAKSKALYIDAKNLTIYEEFIDYMRDMETLYIAPDTKVTYKSHFWNTAAGSLIESCSSLEYVYFPADCDFITQATFESCSPRLTVYALAESKTAQKATSAWLNVNNADYEENVAVISKMLAAAYPLPPRTYVQLQKGSKGKDVVLLQERLNELGYSVGTADGSYGMKSVNAVTEFQANNGIEATGIADVATQEVLFSDAAIGK